MKIRIALFDAHGNEVETKVALREEAALVAARFVLAHGADNEQERGGAQAGIIEFEPHIYDLEGARSVGTQGANAS